MTLLIDTNVIMDVLGKREPFFQDSYAALHKCIKAETECLISVSAVTDIFYLLRKSLHSAERAKEQIEQLSQIVTFADVQAVDVQTALMREMPDFEDAIVDAVAERKRSDYILTRNVRDFSKSKIPAITPTDFLNI